METKMIREYRLANGILHCISTPLFTDDYTEGDKIYLSARVYPKDPASLDCMRFRVQSHSEVSPAVVIGELEFFIKTIKQMFEL